MSAANIPQFLDSQRRLADRADRSGALRRFWCVGLFCLLGFALLDFALVFAPRIRWTAWSAFALLVIVQLALSVRILLQRRSRKQLAAEVEQASGEPTVALTTAADDHVREQLEQHDLGNAVLARLDAQAHGVAERAPVDFRRTSRRWLGLLALTLGGFLAFGVAAGFRSYGRILMPWLPLTYTQIEFRGPTVKVPQQTPFRLHGQLRGRQANTAALHSSFSDQATSVALNADGSFAVELPGISEDATYWVTAGDGTSQRVTVRTFVPTEILEFTADVTPPEYAARLKRQFKEPNFEVLRGSSVDYRIRLSQEVDRVLLLPSPNGSGDEPPAIPLGRSSDPHVYRLRLTNFDKDLTYRFEITDPRGDVTRNDEPFRILVLPDDPPKLRITGHDARRTLKKGDENVTVRVKASDDVGLAKLRLVYRKAGTPGAEVEVPINDKRPFEFTAKSLLKMAPLKLEPLDVVAVHAEGEDGNVLDGPGVAKSQVVVIEVPPPPKKQAKGGGGGGGGGQSVNPLEMQKYILQDTSALAADAGGESFDELQEAQDEVNKFAAALLKNVQAKIDENPRARGIAAQLELALSTMHLSSRQLNKDRRDQSVLAQEFAVATLTQAAKMMGGDT